jgi:hypothetical protein
MKLTRVLPVLLITVAVAVPFRGPFAASATSSTTTVDLRTAGAPFLQGTFQTVNNESGNQTNPHVQCNLVSYTFDDFQGQSTIHYHDLVTGTDNIIPGNSVDLLSDISGAHVAYTEVDFPGDRLMVFDTTSQTRTVVPGLGQSNPAIGGNLVAFEYRSSWLTGQSEISTYDLSTGTVTPLTNDGLSNKNANVSPNGDAVVWEKCQTNGLDCAVYSALQTAPGVFTTRALTEPAGNFHLPFTNGEIAVYVSDRTGENDVYYQALAGGTEVHLAIPGNQRSATISGDLISFESQDQNGYDIFVYDIRSGKLFQVTNTLGDEFLGEISICNGVGRIVYTIVGDGAFDVDAFSFEVPGVTEDQIDQLITLIRNFNLPPGTANSLITKLQGALTAIDSGDMATACTLLTDFTNECSAQSGKRLTTDQATQLINSANQIKSDLGCQ